MHATRNRTFVCSFALVALAGIAQAQPCETLSKLVGSSPAAGDYFGYGMSMSFGGPNNRPLLAVGRPGRDAAGTEDVGGWSVYQRNTNGTWFLIHDAVNPAGEAGELAGASIAIADPYMVVGAPEWGNRGRVRVLRRATGSNTWTLEEDLNPGLVQGHNDALFGQHVAITSQDGGWLIVGAPRFSLMHPESGAIYIFLRNASGEWIQRYTMSGGQFFGRETGFRGASVAMSQTTEWVAWGAPGEAHGNTGPIDGVAYVMRLSSLAPQALSAPVREAGQEFGAAVAVEGNWLAVGAPKEDGSAAETGLANDLSNSGAVYLFERVTNTWLHRATMRAPFPTMNAEFGARVAMSDSQFVVSELGTRRIYVYRRDGANWEFQSTFQSNDDPTGSNFGTRVAIRDGLVAAGDRANDANGLAETGAVFTTTVSPTLVSGDSCSDPLPMPTGNFVGCTQTATPSIGVVTTCGLGVPQGPDVWFRFTPACDGNAIVDTLGSDFDTILSVHSDCPAPGVTNSIACNDDGGFAAPNNRASILSLNFQGGQTYLIRVSGYNTASGQYTLRSLISYGVTNDECSSATTIGLGSRALSTCAATNSPTAGVPLGSVRDVWFRFIAPASSTYSFDTCGSSFDTVLTVFNGSQSQCPTTAAAMIAQNNDSTGTCNPSGASLQSKVAIAMTAGQSVLIRVGGANANAFGSGTLRISQAGCDSIDFNNNSVFPEDQDVIDFFNVLSGGACSPGNTCSDIDFNNNDVFPEDQDVIDFFVVLAGGECS